MPYNNISDNSQFQFGNQNNQNFGQMPYNNNIQNNNPFLIDNQNEQIINQNPVINNNNIAYDKMLNDMIKKIKKK